MKFLIERASGEALDDMKNAKFEKFDKVDSRTIKSEKEFDKMLGHIEGNWRSENDLCYNIIIWGYMPPGLDRTAHLLTV